MHSVRFLTHDTDTAFLFYIYSTNVYLQNRLCIHLFLATTHHFHHRSALDVSHTSPKRQQQPPTTISTTTRASMCHTTKTAAETAAAAVGSEMGPNDARYVVWKPGKPFPFYYRVFTYGNSTRYSALYRRRPRARPSL